MKLFQHLNQFFMSKDFYDTLGETQMKIKKLIKVFKVVKSDND